MFSMYESLFILLYVTKTQKKGMGESLLLGKHAFPFLWKNSKIWVVDKSLSNCTNLINFNKGKYEVLHQEQNNPVQQ